MINLLNVNMSLLELLSKAIDSRKPISFEYNVSHKVSGVRFGHPHAIFSHPTTNNVMFHIYQTHGVSDTKDKLPGWRQPILEHITNIIILEDEESFLIAEGYKPNSPLYAKVFTKI